MSEEVTRVYEFGAFRLDAAEGRLLRDGQAVPLTPKAFEALVALVESDGRTLSRDDLINRLWPESFVEEGNLKVTIFKLRKALGEHDGQEQYIETIPRRGYRFIVPVRAHEVTPSRLILEKRTTSHVLIEQEETPDPPRARTVTAAPGAAPRRLRKRAWALGLLLVALCAAIVGYRLLGNQRQTGTAPTPRSIAVLPFKSLNADEGDDYLGLGMADTLITKLSRLRQVIVRSTGAVRRYGGEQDAVAAGRELKVEAVLEGSIQRSGERLRLTVRLVRVSDGESLWADIFAADFKDVFTVQDSVSERVAAALALTLSGEERQQLTKRYTDSTEAYQLYLKGRYYWNKRSPAAIKKGVEYFGQAIALDKDYALAYAGLADSYVMLGKDWHAKAKSSAARALELDEQLAEAHTSLAMVAMRSEWNWPVTEKELLRALELNPNYATAHQWYSIYLELTGHHEEAVAEARRAQSLDPLSIIINASLGDRLYYARQYDEALAQLRSTVEMDPDFAETRSSLGHVYLQLKMTDEAVAEFQREGQLSGSRLALASLGQAYARSGRAGAARRVIAELEAQLPSGLASPDYIASVYISLGDKEAALIWLERAYEARSDLLVFVKVDPIWDGLRADPRFQDLLRRIGLG